MVDAKSVNPFVLITGGSAGIGLELSKLFAADSYNLIIVSKPEDELKAGKETLLSAYPGIEIKTIQKDLSVQGAALEVYNEVKEMGIEIDVLVNNAGFATFGYVKDIEMERELSMINLNVCTVYHLTRLFMADMIERDKGRIMNVSSTAALNPTPHFATYAATKAFVLSFSEALNFELKHMGSSVKVTALCPPPVRTGFQKAAKMEHSSLFEKSVTMDAPEVAKGGYTALFEGKSMIIPSASFRMIMKITGLIPKNARMKALMDGIQ
ncbi:MAG: SDR family NAD(P)-dependent oxidoreductase [Proteobacteria bacterium]|nr:SDR family NAD(P)-dependent oxidoreductase [Pseudomonadota bacterium]